MVAIRARIFLQFSFRQKSSRFVCRARISSINFDFHRIQRRHCAAADSSANERAHSVRLQKIRKCFVSRAANVNDFRSGNFSVRDFIKFKKFRVSKVLKNFPVFF